MDILQNAVVGLLTGVGYAVLGAGANIRKDSKEKIDVVRIGKTALVGAIAGLLFGMSGVNFDSGAITIYTEMAVDGGLIFTLKKLASIVLG